MELSVIAFLVLLGAVAALRLVELRISQRHQREMAARGAAKVNDPRFRWMVLLHTFVLLGAAVEVEALWNELARQRRIGLLCAHLGTPGTDPDPDDELALLLAAHTRVATAP